MRVIRPEFSSLHLCSLTFPRPLRTLFSFCLRPLLDERLMTSIRGLRLLIRFRSSMNSHLEVIFIYIKIFLFFNEWRHLIYKECNLAGYVLTNSNLPDLSLLTPHRQTLESGSAVSQSSPVFAYLLLGFPERWNLIPRRTNGDVLYSRADCVWLDPPTSGPSTHCDLLRTWKVSSTEYATAAGTILMLKMRKNTSRWAYIWLQIILSTDIVWIMFEPEQKFLCFKHARDTRQTHLLILDLPEMRISS